MKLHIQIQDVYLGDVNSDAWYRNSQRGSGQSASMVPEPPTANGRYAKW